MALPAGFLLALDGVLVTDGVPVTGSVEAIVRLRAMGCPFRILADATPASREVLAAQLGELGFSIDPEEIMVDGRFEPGTTAEPRSEAATHPRSELLRAAAKDLRLPTGAAILVVGDHFDSEILPALDLGFQGLLVRSAGSVEDERPAGEIPQALVAVNFGSWLYRVLRLR